MWIARDKDGDLYLYEDKPIRKGRRFEIDQSIPFGESGAAEVNGDDFSPLSEVTWENSPKELIIK